MGAAFEKYVERNWKDALNIFAGDPHRWEAGGGRSERGQVERLSWERPQTDKVGGARKKTTKATGAASIVVSGLGYKGRRCRFHKYTGCTEDHVPATCKDFRCGD